MPVVTDQPTVNVTGRTGFDNMPESFRSADNLDLLRRIAWEAEVAKQLLRNAGYGVTGTSLLETVKECLADTPTIVEAK